MVRLLFPSWRFFDRVSSSTVLEYRLGESGEWRPALTAPPVPLSAAFFNPDGNWHLALSNLVDRFAAELVDKPDDIERLPAFRPLRRLVRWLAREQGADPATAWLRLRVEDQILCEASAK